MCFPILVQLISAQLFPSPYKKMKTKFFLFIFILLIQLISSFSCVNSQSDSCSNNLSNLKGISFNTTSLSCFDLWTSRGYVLRYSKTGSDIWSFLLSAPNTKNYIAIGFSEREKMIGSSSMVGWIGNNNIGIAKQYFLAEKRINAVRPDQGNLTLVKNSETVVTQNSRLYLAFQLKTAQQPSTNIIYSIGPDGLLPNSQFQLSQHLDQGNTLINYQTGQAEVISVPYTRLRRGHGSLNMIGWGLCLLIGAMVARYLREKDPLWFYLHACIQVVGFILGVFGILTGLVLEDVLSASVDRHKTIGIFVIIFGCLQVIAFLARPKVDSKFRFYWNIYHWTVGRTMIILAAANVFYGLKLADEHKGWTAGYAVALSILIVTAIGLEIRMRMRK
ncbi:cytochrome b561 and DOMON domain-containing protein At3g07570-like [Papaver somniferum]|uniref:cytochrome b561 and DOMON domain-containing protein At3g07570-like n=1 Tax=Papaver somniferum TaxID=3469 RepID=UPI000E6F6FC1|nr:cytochrome b561 and DOMON domain-containing protein At3g07570-like [Papaver somniferum]